MLTVVLVQEHEGDLWARAGGRSGPGDFSQGLRTGLCLLPVQPLRP